MNYRLIATERRLSRSGLAYDHIVWMGEFNPFEAEEEEAFELARATVGQHCMIQVEPIPTNLH